MTHSLGWDQIFLVQQAHFEDILFLLTIWILLALASLWLEALKV